jgi:hypothetical protein
LVSISSWNNKDNTYPHMAAHLMKAKNQGKPRTRVSCGPYDRSEPLTKLSSSRTCRKHRPRRACDHCLQGLLVRSPERLFTPWGLPVNCQTAKNNRAKPVKTRVERTAPEDLKDPRSDVKSIRSFYVTCPWYHPPIVSNHVTTIQAMRKIPTA